MLTPFEAIADVAAKEQGITLQKLYKFATWCVRKTEIIAISFSSFSTYHEAPQ